MKASSPRCVCGFDFVKALINRIPIRSYALIPQKRYRAIIRREYAIIVERDAEKKNRSIANASTTMGSMMQCPKCQSWLFDEPSAGSDAAFTVLRKAIRPSKKVIARRKSGRSSAT